MKTSNCNETKPFICDGYQFGTNTEGIFFSTKTSLSKLDKILNWGSENGIGLIIQVNNKYIGNKNMIHDTTLCKQFKLKDEEYINTVTIYEQNWNDFATVFEQVYPAFFEKLKSRYPKITPSEIHLLALSKLDKMVSFLMTAAEVSSHDDSTARIMGSF